MLLRLAPIKRGESSAAIRACNDYLRMGPARSVRGLGAQYRKTAQNRAPTQSYPTLRAWSEKFEWKNRARQFDANGDQLQSAVRARVFKEGLALDFERVNALKRVGSLLQEQIFEQGVPEGKEVDALCPECGASITIRTGDMAHPFPNIWIREVKTIGSGEDVKPVHVHKFNAPLLGQYRAVLDDLAKETGARHPESEMLQAIHALYAKIDPNKATLEQANDIFAGEETLTALVKQYFYDQYLDVGSEIAGEEAEYVPDPEAEQRGRDEAWERAQASVEANRRLQKQQEGTPKSG